MKSTWGTIRQRGGNSFEIRYRVAGERVSETFRGTRAEAERRLSLLRLVHEGAEGADVTLSEFWACWFEPSLADLAPSTAHGYRSQWRNHVEPQWGGRAMGSVRPSEVQRWLLTLSAGVAGHCRTLMSSMFSKACMEGLCASNPMLHRYRMPTRVARPSVEGVLDMAELEAIADACRGQWWEPCFLLSAFAGLRRAEAVGCRVEDVAARDDGFLAVDVRRGVQRVDGDTIVVPPKTGERTALMLPRHAVRMAGILEGREPGWIVGGSYPCNPDNMTSAWKRWFVGQPFRFVPFKNLRNSYVTWMLAEGYPAETVSKLCGHSRTVEYRHYLRPDADDLARSLGAFGGNPGDGKGQQPCKNGC